MKISASIDFLHPRVVKTDTGSLVVEGFDIFNVPEDGVLLAADLRRCVRTVGVLHVMEGEEVDIFYELGFAIYQVLDELAGGTKVSVMVCSVALVREDAVYSQ